MTAQGGPLEVVRPRVRGDIRSYTRQSGLSTVASSCLFRKRALETAGEFDESLLSHIDYDIWLQLAGKRCSADYVDGALVRCYARCGRRMTTDIGARLRASRMFCDKWRPELADWYTTWEARQFCVRFTAQVTGGPGWVCILQGDKWQPARLFLSALGRQPLRRSCYAGLLALFLGRPFVNDLRLRARPVLSLED